MLVTFLLSPLLSALLATAIALPGGPPVGMDYLAYDAAHQRIWVPAGNSGSVDVIDVATGKVTAVGGFPTAPSPRPGRPNRGPSSAAVAGGQVWIGNRADDNLCPVDARTLTRGTCLRLGSAPDGLAFVATTGELWATTPRDQTITVVDVSGKKPSPTATIKIDGDPEGVAVDAARGLFYTNVEDRDRTLAIDVRTRKIVASWPAGCGAAGPRGLALDGERQLLFVACTDGAAVFDVAHTGKTAGKGAGKNDAREVGRLKTGGGVDNIDYAPKRGLLFVASGADAKLTIARVGAAGALAAVGSSPTAPGARCVVVDGDGTAYVADSAGGRLIVVKPPAR
jgi:DNA-binding beta-propeller fold protein YncE